MLKETEKEKEKLAKIFGFGIGALTLVTVAIVSAPVAIPAIGIGLGAVGLGGALSGTAIGFGLVGVSAVVGGVVGRVSAPGIYEATSGLFGNNGGGYSAGVNKEIGSPSQDDNSVNNGVKGSPVIHSANGPLQPLPAPRGGSLHLGVNPDQTGGDSSHPEVPGGRDQSRPTTPPARNASIDSSNIPLPPDDPPRTAGQPPAGAPPPALVAPQPNLDAIYIEYYPSLLKRKRKRKYKPLEEQSKELQDAVNAFKSENRLYYDRFPGFDSSNKDLIIYQYKEAKQEIEAMEESGKKLSQLTHEKVKHLKKFYPGEDFSGDKTVKDFLQGNLTRIEKAFIDLSSGLKTTHQRVIEDKIIRLNMAIAIIEGRDIKERQPANYCGISSASCFPLKQSKTPSVSP